MSKDFLADQFRKHRPRLHAVAYRMLGSATEADDAVQETWVRLDRSDAASIGNLGGWLTTVTGRVCLNMLRARRTRREAALDPRVPDPVVQPVDATDPEEEALLTDSVGLALLLVLDTLTPAERLAFVLHDVFAVSFTEIAEILDRSPDAARKLASRARRQIQGAAAPDPDMARQRAVVDAFFAAARGGDFEALVSVLDPDVVLRSDGGTARPVATALVRGAAIVASRAMAFALPHATLLPVLVNGSAGVVVTVDDEPASVMEFTIVDHKIVAIDVLADPERVSQLVSGVLQDRADSPSG
jgi:RNA polymerase sigma-70 factor (ECF subfamily)